MSTRAKKPEASTAAPDVQTQIAAMVEHLRPHSGSDDALWAAMPGAFLLSVGREVDKANAYDIAMCQIALSAIAVLPPCPTVSR
jgi:hypothetical protein